MGEFVSINSRIERLCSISGLSATHASCLLFVGDVMPAANACLHSDGSILLGRERHMFYINLDYRAALFAPVCDNLLKIHEDQFRVDIT